jgi:uracil-DNA glycosylase
MQLLTNILNAIGCGISRLPQMDLVEWPPYPNASGDESEVREFLGTLLNARLAKKPVKSILLLGDSAANWLLSSDLNEQKGSGRVALSEQTTALLLPSLSSMIENPQQKAVAWKLLQLLLPQSS